MIAQSLVRHPSFEVFAQQGKNFLIAAWVKRTRQEPGNIFYDGVYWDPPAEEQYKFKNKRSKKAPASLR